MKNNKYLLLFVVALFLTLSSCKEQGESFFSWRNTTSKTMLNSLKAYLHLSANKDTAVSVNINYHADVEGEIVLELDTVYYIRSFAIIEYNSGLRDTGYNQYIHKFRTGYEDVWFHKIDFNGYARTEATSFVMNNKAYIACGWDGVSLQKDLWRYDPDFDTWSQVSSLNGPARMSAAAFVMNDTVYFGTGIINHATSERSRAMWKWTITGQPYNTWRRIDSLGDGMNRSGCIAYALNDKYGKKKGYIGLGMQTFTTNDIYWYDLKGDSTGAPTGAAWVQTDIFLGGYRTDAVVSIINNRAVVGSGTDNNGDICNDFYIFDPTSGTSGTWSSITPAPIARTGAVSFSLSFIRPRTDDQYNYFYFGTGEDASGTLHNDWWRYDFATKNWEECAFIHEKTDSADVRKGAVAFSLNLGHVDFGTVERGYVALGFNGTTYKRDVWEYLP